MTSQAIEHPSVSLRVDHLLTPAEQALITAANASTKADDAFEAAIKVWREHAIRQLRLELAKRPVVDTVVIEGILNVLWRAYVPVFRRATGPSIVDAYIKAFSAVRQEGVPIQLIYALADEHADRVGAYFNDTSTEALTQGFNTYINRKVPQRAAVERVIDAYGLTPRQMSGFTSAVALEPQPMATSVPQKLKRKIQGYIGRSISQRLKVFKGQEAHNLDEQAKQVAWLYLIEHGKITDAYQKQWLTAEDERVCPICAPMHKKKVGIKEQFILPNGIKLYVPSPHVNCRCTTRLIAPLELIQKADWDAREHPRGNPGNRGQFRRVARRPDPQVADLDPVVEEALLRARELQRKELEEKIDLPVAPEAPQKVDFGGSSEKVDFGGSLARVNLGSGKVDLGGAKVDLSAQLKSKAVDLGLVTPTTGQITPTSRRVELPAQQQVNAELLLLGRMAEIQQKVESQKRKVKEVFRPTVKFQDSETGDHLTGFAVIPTRQLDPERALLTEDDYVRLIPKGREKSTFIFNAVADQFTLNQKDAIRAIMGFDSKGKQREFAKVTKPSKQGPVYAEVPVEAVFAAMDGAVNKDQEWATEEPIHLEWRRVSDDEVAFGGDYDDTGSVNAIELAKLLEIDVEDLMVTVVQLTEGYDDAYQFDHKSRHGPDIWKAPGNYKILYQDNEVLSPGVWGDDSGGEIQVPVQIFHVDPEVEPDFYVERDWVPNDDNLNWSPVEEVQERKRIERLHAEWLSEFDRGEKITFKRWLIDRGERPPRDTANLTAALREARLRRERGED